MIIRKRSMRFFRDAASRSRSRPTEPCLTGLNRAFRTYYFEPMAAPRQLSPDGAYWWDGQAWQPTASESVAVPIAQTASDAPRPSWLPQGVELPSPSDPPDAPLTPAEIGSPDG